MKRLQDMGDAIDTACTALQGCAGILEEPRRGLMMGSQSARLRSLCRDTREGQFKVVFFGDFNRGKSTTVNALSGQPLMPVRTLPCTAIITKLVYGEDGEPVTLHMHDGTTRDISREEMADVYHLTRQDRQLIEEQGALNRFADISHAVVRCPYRLLKNGVQIIDSPGLGESTSRSQLTHAFLPEANAVVMLLDASNLISDAERTFIANRFAGKCPRNVFFLINKINLVPDDEKEDVVETARDIIQPIFTDANGNKDETLYAQRVFMVNSLEAMKARGAGREAEALTGIPAFESALEAFLMSDARLESVLEPARKSLSDTISRAESILSARKEAMGQSMEELQGRQAKSTIILDDLNGQIDSMEKLFRQTATLVETKAFASLKQYISVELPARFNRDSKTMERRFGIGKLLNSAFVNLTVWNKDNRQARMQKIIQPLADQLRDYIEEQLYDWGRQIGQDIAEDIETLQDATNADLRDFANALTRAASTFSGGAGGDFSMESINALQLILSAIQGDLSVLVEGAGGMRMDWGEWFKRYIVQGVVQMILFTLVTGGAGFVVFLAYELLQMAIGAKRNNDLILKKIGEKLFDEMAASLPAHEADIRGSIRREFAKAFDKLSANLRALVEEERNRQQDIIDRIANHEMDAQLEASLAEETLCLIKGYEQSLKTA